MLRFGPLFVALALVAAAAEEAWGKQHEAFTDADKAGPDFLAQGEYRGKLDLGDGPKPFGAQVVALGSAKFDLVLYRGGLPGEGWRRGDQRERASGERATAATVFKGPNWKAVIEGHRMNFTADRKELGSLKKVERKSPTLGAKPPAGAVVLFDSTSVDEFPGAKMTPDDLLMVPATSKRRFGDFQLHLEFRTPFMPTARGQGRGNSGVYLQNHYEVQILDSFGLEGANNECGGIYSLQEPAVNMCYPPLAWQTYDIRFKGPRFEGGKKTEHPRVTIEHNGVNIYRDFEITKITPGGDKHGETADGPLFLQDHSNPVVYRNIWVVPSTGHAAARRERE